MNNEQNRPEAQRGGFFQDVNPARQFFYDTKPLNIDNPSFLDDEGRVNNQSQLRQSFLNVLGGELGNISVIGAAKILPDQSIDVGGKGFGGNILDNSLLKEKALFQPENELPKTEGQQVQEDHYRLGEKVSKGKGSKYTQFDNSESQIDEEQQQQAPHSVFKQYEDDDIDLEYNFNNLLNNIENLNPELLQQNPTPQPQQVPQNNDPQRAAGQNYQTEAQQQAAVNVPEIPEEELNKIYNSYADINHYLLFFYTGLLSINCNVVPPITIFGIMWAVDILVFWKNIREFRSTPADEGGKRRKYMALAIECMLYALCKGYILYSLRVNPEFLMTYTIGPCLCYTIILCGVVGTVGTSVDIAWLCFRFLFWLQMLMVFMKLDNLIDWDWRGVFWLFWFIFFLVAFYCAGLLLVLTCLLYFLIVKQIQGYQFCGLLWLLVFLAGNSVVVFGIITGFVRQQEIPTNKSLLEYSMLGGIAQQVFMMIFSRIFKKQLKEFYLQILRQDTTEQRRRTRKEITYEQEQERNNYPGFLIMFSPTYFMTYEQRMKLKKQRPALLNRLRNIKYQKTHAKRPEMMARTILQNLTTTTNKNLLSPPTLGDKMNLISDTNTASISTVGNKKFNFHQMTKGTDDTEAKSAASSSSNLQQLVSPDRVLKIKKGIQNKSYIDTRVIEAAQKQLEREKNVEKLEKIQSEGVDKQRNDNLSQVDNQKSVLSEGDAEYVEGGQNLSQLLSIPLPNKQGEVTKDKEEPCQVCFDKVPDAVIMSCGHGGLCYECALMIWKKSPDCFMCRKPIEKILQIDVNSKKRGITKVIGSTKMVMKDVECTEDQSQAEDSQFESSASPSRQ